MALGIVELHPPRGSLMSDEVRVLVIESMRPALGGIVQKDHPRTLTGTGSLIPCLTYLRILIVQRKIWARVNKNSCTKQDERTLETELSFAGGEDNDKALELYTRYTVHKEHLFHRIESSVDGIQHKSVSTFGPS